MSTNQSTTEQNERHFTSLKKKAGKLPDVPGVYFFIGPRKKILYIGKATSLRDRVRSYFAPDISVVRSPLIEKMVNESVSLDHKKTDSVLEALMLEADLIKTFKPIYNSKEKDDKSFNCIVITDEKFPRILVVRKKELGNFKTKYVFGPYPQGASLRDAIKIIRKIFPYRDDKCVKAEDQIQKNLNKKNPIKNFRPRPCFNRTIGLCPGTCTGEITAKEYSETIRHLALIFKGKISVLIKSLEKEMHSLAKLQEFERASLIKNKIYALTHIHDVSLIKSDQFGINIGTNANKNSIDKDFSNIASDIRIESYDIAHLGGSAMVGVMIVFTNGTPDKSQYRLFNIKNQKGVNDISALKEIMSRRLTHSDWPAPNIVVVDGGEAQYRLTAEFFPRPVSVVAVVKDETHRANRLLGDPDVIKKNSKVIIASNAEAHRFAISRHKRLRNKGFLPKK